MKIHYFFRKASPVFHSIEEQFFAVQKALPTDISYKNVFAPYHSKGLFRRLGIALQAAFRQGDLNHITGDIHFAVLLMRKKKTILTVHDIGSVLKGGGIRQKILRLFWFSLPFARVKYLTVISEFTKHEILKNFKIKPEKIRVIPDCVSDDFQYLPKDFNTEKARILHIGTKQNKNLERLISALEGVNCKLVIIGRLSDSQKQALEKHALDYENYYNLPFGEIVEQYKQCDIVSFVTLYEGFGVPVLEAQATGRPLLASNRSPVKENAGKGALLVNPESTVEIRKGILRLINEPDLRRQLINNGLENVKKFRPAAVAKNYYELYKEVLGK